MYDSAVFCFFGIGFVGNTFGDYLVGSKEFIGEYDKRKISKNEFEIENRNILE